jgi:N-acetylated-alpha-linked acidic dipeptidase
MGFGGDYGVYHSAYDSFYWMENFGDPGFKYHVAAAQIWGTMTLRLANADVLSFDFTDYANQIRDYFREAQTLARRRNLHGSFDEKAMNAALDEFLREANRVEKLRQEYLRKDVDQSKLKQFNDALMLVEREFIDDRGLKGRSWYKHQIYAPGIYTGYAAQPLTDFRQSLDERNSGATAQSLERIVEAVRRATKALAKAE